MPASLELLKHATLLQQGAEARVYKATIHPNEPPILLKHRFPKKYRHTALDASLTRQRVGAEARALMRCLRGGISVPGIKMVDADQGLLGLELIEGKAVRHILPGAEDEEEEEEGEPVAPSLTPVDSVEEFGVSHELKPLAPSIEQIMQLIGTEIAKMHLANIIHGDLTTSNMMLRRSPSSSLEVPAEIVLIDFGLTSTSNLAEDKAVDLYVLERAFASTHPDSEVYFKAVLDAYAAQSGKAWEPIRRRLEDVRMRGRKRSMVG